MRMIELLRLVWLNISQNKFKSVMTSIGIVVGAATIVLVFGIGRGGQMDIADQFAELNAGAIDISYDYEGEEERSGSGGFSFQNIGAFFGNMFGGFGSRGGRSSETGSTEANAGGGNMNGDSNMMDGGNMPGGGAFSAENMPEMLGRGEMPDGAEFDAEKMPENFRSGEERASQPDEADAAKAENGSSSEEEDMENSPADAEGQELDAESEEEVTSMVDDRMNQEQVILTQDDVDDIARFVSGISGVTISYSTRASVEGANLTSAQTYTVAGVKESYESVSKLVMEAGYFIAETDEEAKSRVCALGSSVAEELFDSVEEAVGSTIYIDDRTYTIVGVLEQSGTVSAGISPDTAIFVPYATGIKYITGENIDPVITVIAENVDTLSEVIAGAQTVLEENYTNVRFTFEDSGSKMEAAESSNRILTMLLTAMAVIVFIVGGIGIMNVLFVSVKERTNEIGILKAIGTSRGTILSEFLIEAAAISFIGGILGVAISFGIIPIVEHYDVRVEVNTAACLAALGFAVLTGTIFGIYPAWKASSLEPVEALNAE